MFVYSLSRGSAYMHGYSCTMRWGTLYLTISRRKRGDYKLIFTKPRGGDRGEYELVITEPETINCFSIQPIQKRLSFANLKL